MNSSMAHGSILALALAGILALAWATVPVQAETITWTNTAGGNWHDAANWDPQNVPDHSGEEALVVDDGLTYTIYLNGGVNVDRLSLLNPNATFDLLGYAFGAYLADGLDNHGTVLTSTPGGWTSLNARTHNRPGAELQVPGGGNIFYGATTLMNEGTIRVNSNLSTSDACFYANAGTNVTMTGPGELLLQTASDETDARLYSYAGGLIQGQDHTIRGSGTLNINLTNDGALVADVPGQKIRFDGGTIVNNGLFRAVNGGILDTGVGISQGAGGQLIADGGTVQFRQGSSVAGGSLDARSGGVMRLIAGHASGLYQLTHLGTFDVPGGSTLYLGSTSLTNDGTFVINSDLSGGTAYVSIHSGSTLELTGSGEIRLQTTGDPNQARLAAHSGQLRHGAGHTIHGAGILEVGLTNEGTISADASGKQLWLGGGGVPKTNRGRISATNDGVLMISSGTITQEAVGELLADGGTISLENGASVGGGTLRTANSGVIEKGATGYAFIWNTTNEGDFRVRAGGQLYVAGDVLTNHGTITLNPEQSTTDAYLYCNAGGSDTLLLAGTGDLILKTSGTDVGDATLAHHTGCLRQGTEHTIRGEGYVSVQLVNDGSIVADAPDRRLFLGGSTPKVNRGLLQAIGGGVLSLGTGTISQGPSAVIEADGGRVVLDHASAIYGGRLRTVHGGTMQTGTGWTELYRLTNEGQIGVRAGTQCYIGRAGFVNDGTITINSDQVGTTTYLFTVADGTECVLAGTGEIVMRTAGSPSHACFQGHNGTLRQAATHTVRGEGSIIQTMTNEGTIAADVSGRSLYFNSGWLTNEGTVRATGGGTFDIIVACQNNGLMEASEGGTFRLGYPWNHYNSNTNTFTGGTWQIRDGSTMRWIDTDVRTLQAALSLHGSGAALYRDGGTADALANLHTVGRGGHLAFHEGRDFTTAGSFTVDEGRLTVGEGSLFSVNGQFTQHGNDEDPNFSGYTLVNGTLVATGDPLDIQGGRLGGNGTIQNSVTNAGGICPGASAGRLTIAGDFTQTEEGTCWIELAGPSAGQYDQVQVQGQAILSGRLVVTSIQGYQPQVGDRFTLLTCAARSGMFTLETGAPGLGVVYETHYHPDRVEIEILADMSYVAEPESGGEAAGEPEVGPNVEIGESPEATGGLPNRLGFHARTEIGGAGLVLELPHPAHVTVEIFDYTGRRLAVLEEGSVSAGRRGYAWDGSTPGGGRAASGVYFARARVSSGQAEEIRQARVVVVR